MGCLKLTYEPTLKVITRTEKCERSREANIEQESTGISTTVKNYKMNWGLTFTTTEHEIMTQLWVDG